MQRALEQLGTECSIEGVMILCPELTRNQVCVVIDYLGRAGVVAMVHVAAGRIVWAS